MGMENKVPLAAPPPWPAVAARLTAKGLAAQIKMIDGQLAFPDEQPPEAWQELRVGLPGGMVTLRRVEDGVLVITWGNAEEALRRSWQALTEAVVEAGGGKVS